MKALSDYLWAVSLEAGRRGYRFDSAKLPYPPQGIRLTVTEGQLTYEVEHLNRKLLTRTGKGLEVFQPHPMFERVPGETENWERITAGPSDHSKLK